MADENKKTLLLVEDEAIIAIAQRMTLEKCGYKIIIANSGEKALDVLSKNDEVALILMDIDLGSGIDGTETALRILQERQVPIVFLSSHTEPEIVEKTEKITSYGYVVKNSGTTVLDASIKMAFKLFDAHLQIGISEIKQKAMISNISDVIGIINTDGIMSYKSPNIEKWFGWQQDDLVGADGWAMVHPDDLERIRNVFLTFLEKDYSSKTVEFRYRCKDGTYKPVELTALNLTNDPVIGGILINYHDITERKNSEDALRESEERFRRVFEDGQIGIVIVNEDFIFENVNPAFCSFIGYTADELSFMTFREVTHPGHVKTDVENIVKLKNGEIPFYSTEKRYIRKNGDTVWGNLVISVVYGKDNEFLYYLGTVEDITERKIAEAALNESELVKSVLLERLNKAQQIAMIGSWEWDLKTNEVWWSDETYRIYGVTKEEYRPDFEENGKFIHHDDLAQYGLQFEHSFKTGEPLEYQFRLVTGDGDEKYCYARGEIEYGRDGKPARFTGTLHDITRIKHSEAEVKAKNEELEALNEELNATVEEMETSNAELADTNRELLIMDGKLQDTLAALRNNETRMRTLLQTVPDLIWLKDKDGVYLLCNAMFERFFGASEADIAGKTDYDFMDSGLAEFFRENDRRAMDAGKPTVNEEWITFADDGHRALLETIKTPMYDNTGSLVGILGIGRDITERKLAEEEIKIKNGELEALNEELNAAIEELEAGNEELIASSDDLRQKEEILLNEKIFTEALFDSIPGYLYVYDDMGNLIRWNKKHETMTGYSAEELSHMNMSQWYEGDDAVRVAAAVDEVFSKGYGEVEANLLIKGGRKILVRSTGVALTIDGKSYFTGIGIDIGEQRKMENELKESEEKFRAIIDTLPIAIYLSSGIEQKSEYINPAMVKLFGYTDRDIPTAAEWWPLAYPDEEYRSEVSKEWTLRVARAIETQTSIEPMETIVTCKDGSTRYMYWGYIALGNKNYSYGLDLTGQKQVEEKLRNSEERLSFYIENSPMAVIEWDSDFVVTRWTGDSEKIFGWSAEETTGRLIMELNMIYEPDMNIVKNTMNRLTVGHESQVVSSNRNYTKDGKIILCEWYNTIIKDNDGKMLSVLSQVLDITERVAAEEKIKSLLAEKELLLKEVHHRVRNFMNTISSLLILQSSIMKDPAAVKALEEAGGRVKCMMGLYDKLYRSVDINGISVREYIPVLLDEIMANFSGSDNVKLEVKIDDFMLDAKSLQSIGIIINELITNIMKYAFNGRDGGTVYISAERAENHVTFTIKDNGIGMPETAGLDHSPGFGLILVDMMARQLKGSIKLKSNGGTEFVLEFNIQG